MVHSILKFLIVMLTFANCNSGYKSTQQPSNSNGYIGTILPQDSTQLWVSEGNPIKDTVAIFLQGGPKDLLSFKDKGKTGWRYLPNFNNYYGIHLHQSNTFNPEMFLYKGDFTMDMARKEVDNSSEILDRAIKYFKDRDKTVFVFGHSYGAFIIPHYLATRKSLADQYVIVSGRLRDPENEVLAHSRGYNGSFVDGLTFISDEGEEGLFEGYTAEEIDYYKRKQLLKAAIGELNYIEKLEEVDLTGSVFVFNPSDSRVGGLTTQELYFLKSKGCQVYETKHPHGSTIYGLVDGIKEGSIKINQ